ncbi:MAG: hypothetical protein FWE37_09220 [Spirochaetaceae bacterium]|nr:hypothetical protein [Spirochaetaceae bacterium]
MKIPKIKYFFLGCLFTLAALPLFSQDNSEEAAGTVPVRWGVGLDAAFYTNNNISDVAANGFAAPNGLAVPGVLATAHYIINVPLLTGDGTNPLFAGNGLSLRGQVNVTPVTLEGIGSATFSPIAFLAFHATAFVGTGWSLGELATGLALWEADGLNYDSFQGVISGVTFGGRFQFNLGAIIPSTWTNIILLSDNRLQFRHFTAADNNTPYLFKSDGDRRNLNGWRYTASHVIGYQLPFMVNLVAIVTDTETNLGHAREVSTMASGGWGSDFTLVRFGPMANLAFNGQHNLTILAQLQRNVTWHDTETSLINRTYRGNYISFYQLALSYRLNF